jgi:hypothetical protein
VFADLEETLQKVPVEDDQTAWPPASCTLSISGRNVIALVIRVRDAFAILGRLMR